MNDEMRERRRQEEEIRRIADELTPQGLRIALPMMGNLPEAEEAAQDALIRLWKKLGGLYREGGFSGLYSTMVYNECRRRIRRRPPQGESLARLDEMGMGDEDGDPSRPIEEKENQHILYEYLARLPQKQREILVLHYVKKLPFREIGKQLGVTENVASAYASRAVMVLRRMVRKGVLV
jgi:RNA polymerase sigma-70 factor (ECF subfamily)